MVVGGQTRSLHTLTLYPDVYHQLLPETEDRTRWTPVLTQSMYSYADMCKFVDLAKPPQHNGETHHLL